MTTQNRRERRRAHALARSSPPAPPLRSTQPRSAPARSSPPEPGLDAFIDAWARVTTSTRPDVEVLVLETVLANTCCGESLRDGGWITLATTETFLHPAPGFGPARTLGLIARFVDFLRDEGTLDAWSHKRLRHCVERARVANQLIKGPPPMDGRDEAVLGKDLDGLAARFAATLTHPIDREIGAHVVTLTAMFLQGHVVGDWYTQFGALNVSAFVNEWLLHGTSTAEQGANATFLRILADFYVWRGAEGRLDPARATELATELRAAALAHGALRFQA